MRHKRGAAGPAGKIDDVINYSADLFRGFRGVMGIGKGMRVTKAINGYFTHNNKIQK